MVRLQNSGNIVLFVCKGNLYRRHHKTIVYDFVKTLLSFFVVLSC